MPKLTKESKVPSTRIVQHQQASTNARNLLKKLIVLESNGAYGHLWMFEGDRWKELVFALLARTVPRLQETDIRNLVERMHALRLLDVGDLAAICSESQTPDLSHQHARLIVELLIEGSFTREEAERGLLTVCEAALGLYKHFNGKVQQYLRSYGELMLRESKKFFSFSAMSEADVRCSMTYWLQNVLSMPLPLADKNWEVVCNQYGLDPAELVSAADDLDVNLGLLDDLLQSYRARRASEVHNVDAATPPSELVPS